MYKGSLKIAPVGALVSTLTVKTIKAHFKFFLCFLANVFKQLIRKVQIIFFAEEKLSAQRNQFR